MYLTNKMKIVLLNNLECKSKLNSAESDTIFEW